MPMLEKLWKVVYCTATNQLYMRSLYRCLGYVIVWHFRTKNKTQGFLNSLTFLEKCTISENAECLFADDSGPETKRKLLNKNNADGN